MPHKHLHFCNISHKATMYFKLRFYIPVYGYGKNGKAFTDESISICPDAA